MGMAQAQKQSFEERLARINSGAPNTMGEVHIGPPDEAAGRTRPTNTVRLKPRKAKRKGQAEGSNMLLIPMALLIGAISMFAGEAAAFHMFAADGLFPVTLPAALEMAEPYVIFANFAIAAFLGLLFSWAFGFSNLIRKLAVVIGAGAFFWFLPEIVERYPDVFVAFFSEGYVAETSQIVRGA